MKTDAWASHVPLAYRPFHCCVMDSEILCHKPMSYWTNDTDYQPQGTTGNGKCNKGECGLGYYHEGRFNHYGRLAREPEFGPKGEGVARQKNSLPELWMYEVLQSALEKADTSKTVFIDLCAGWQSWKPICEEFGLTYVAVDIMGNRNNKKVQSRED